MVTLFSGAAVSGLQNCQGLLSHGCLPATSSKVSHETQNGLFWWKLI